MNFDWNNFLSSGESVQKEFVPSPRYAQIVLFAVILIGVIVITSGLFVSILLLPSIFIGIFIILFGSFYWFYLKNAKQYAFTNKRILIVQSFPGKSSTSIDYNQITDIEVRQNVFDQIGGWGTILINTAGTHSPQIQLQYVENPHQIKQILDKIRDTK